MKYLYAMINKHSGELIRSNKSTIGYYKTIESLINGYGLGVKDKLDITFKDIEIKKFNLVECDLTDDELNSIDENIDKRIDEKRLLKKLNVINHFNRDIRIHFMQENKYCSCVIIYSKSKKIDKKVSILIDKNTGEEYYHADSIPDLRLVLYDEYKKGNIEILDADLYIKE